MSGTVNRNGFPRGIARRVRTQLTADWVRELSPAERRRVNWTALALAAGVCAIFLAEGQSWTVIPLGVFFFLTARFFALDGWPLLQRVGRLGRRSQDATAGTAAPVIDQRLLEGLLTATDLGAGWTRSEPLPSDGKIIVPCAMFVVLGRHEVADGVSVILRREAGDAQSEGVKQTIAIATSTEVAARRFQSAAAASGCGQWIGWETTYVVEPLGLPTGELDAVSSRLEQCLTRHDAHPPWIIHDCVFRHGRVLVSVRHYRRSSAPELALTSRLVTRAIEAAAALAAVLPAEEPEVDHAPAPPARQDLDQFFPANELPEYFVLETRRVRGPVPDPDDALRVTTLPMAVGHRYGEQRLYTSHLDFFSLEVSVERFASAEQAGAALRHDAEQYWKQDRYGVRRRPIPTIGTESAAVSGRATDARGGSRVACVWFRDGDIVTRYQGYTHVTDPLPVVQTIVENVARRVRAGSR